MLFSYSLTLPAGGSASSLTASVVKYQPGTVRQVFIVFPDGASGQCNFRVRKALHVLWPAQPDAWLVHNDYTFVIPEDLELLEPPHELTLEGYNTDDTHAHTIYFLPVIIPPPAMPPPTLAEQLKSALLGLFRRPEGA